MTGGALGMDSGMHGTIPRDHLVQMPVTVYRRPPRIGRAGQVATVMHNQTARLQRLAQTGHAQRFGTHAGAAHAGTNVRGRADQRHRGSGTLRGFLASM